MKRYIYNKPNIIFFFYIIIFISKKVKINIFTNIFAANTIVLQLL